MRGLVVAAVSVACLAFTVVAPDRADAAALADGPAETGTYTLVTGERVTVGATADGRPTVTLLSGGRADAAFQVLASGDHVYVLPHYAADFLGQPLSLDLFDVSAMNPDGTRPDLTVEYRAGAERRLPPGLRDSADGTVTVADPAAFGTALAAQWRPHRDGVAVEMFAGITRISLAGSAKPEPPPGKLFTVTVKAFDRRGHRVTGDTGVVMNADDSGRFIAGQSFYRGEFAVSVPAGRYSISSFIATVYADRMDVTLAAAPELVVDRDTVVILDARKGQRVSAATPLAASPVHAELNYQRNPASGLSFTGSYVTFGNTALYATPTSQVTTGELHFYPFTRLEGTGEDLRPYQYDLAFAYHGAIPADLSVDVTHDQLARIDARYHSVVPGRAQPELRMGLAPWQAITVGAYGMVAAPAERTEYVSTRPDLLWLEMVGADPQGVDGVAQSHLMSYPPGERTGTDWLAQPMAPGVPQQTAVGQSCPACRSGDTLNLTLLPFVDNDGHLMLPDSATTTGLTLYRDGTPVAESPTGFASFPMSAEPADYTLAFDVARQAPWWPTSTEVHTEWSFASQRRDPDPLPRGWSCGGKGGKGVAAGETAADSEAAAEGCSFEPLLFPRYRTSAGADDVVPAGGQATVDVTVAHQRGAKGAAVTDLTAEVSYDDGKTWRDVPAEATGDGVFRLSYRQPELADTTGFGSLRIRAADAAGNAVKQTILRAYPLAVTAPVALPTGPDAADQPVCAATGAAPYTRCTAVVNAAAGVSASQPVGLGPADLRSAYGFDPDAGEGRTVAVVAAYDNPNAEADLAVYRDHWGLPPCTTDNGCFRKVNQRGEATGMPVPHPGWALEISLDLDAVSAACPSCDILLVEADSASLADLIPAVHTAQRLGADVISNSYGSIGEFSGEQQLERYYRALRVPFVVATGDYGYGHGVPLLGGVSYPSASQFAVAVGGTALTRTDSERGWSESAWDGATSGCSAYVRKPGWQKDDLCGMRTVADVSAVADPNTGLAVYDTFGFGGWLQVGGTSLAAPIVASGYAMAGDGPATGYASGLYRDPGLLHDVTDGANGDTCEGTYLCTAVPGYDGPTGLGTPSSVAAFSTGP